MTKYVNHDILRELGQTVRMHRKAANMTQQELANHLNTDLSVINRLELGKVNPQMSTVFEIAAALNVKMRDFFTE